MVRYQVEAMLHLVICVYVYQITINLVLLAVRQRTLTPLLEFGGIRTRNPKVDHANRNVSQLAISSPKSAFLLFSTKNTDPSQIAIIYSQSQSRSTFVTVDDPAHQIAESAKKCLVNLFDVPNCRIRNSAISTPEIMQRIPCFCRKRNHINPC